MISSQELFKSCLITKDAPCFGVTFAEKKQKNKQFLQAVLALFSTCVAGLSP